jgi:hypothetical protein
MLACLLLAGCQSGQVCTTVFSEDTGTIAYRDPKYHTVYLADERGVAEFGTGEFVQGGGDTMKDVEHSSQYRRAEFLRLNARNAGTK